MKKHQFAAAERIFIENNASGRSHKELTELFNKRFNADLTVVQISAFLKRNGLRNGINTRFLSGRAPYNAGLKRWWTGSEKSQFQKGRTATNYRPLGSERVNKEGYVEVKVGLPDKWKGKHRIIWESKFGETPKGYVIIFADGNKLNTELENLILISRAQLVVLNKKSLISSNAELTKTGILVADVCLKIGELKRVK